MKQRIHVVRTGAANLASVCAALGRLGAEAVVTDDAEEVARAGLVVLPGVEAFGPAMEGLRRRGLDGVLRARAEGGGALLAICLGMQLLFESSQESPGVGGLGVVRRCVERFAGVPRVPQMGWNRVVWEGAAGAEREESCAYFANSFRVSCREGTLDGLRGDGWRVATAEYGGRFVAGLERGGVLACQFHPELSGAAGLALLGGWVRRGAGLAGGVGC